MAHSKLSHNSMRRVPNAELASSKHIASILTLILAIGAFTAFARPVARASNVRQRMSTATKAQIATKFLVMDHDTVSSPLPEGDTTFIIFLARSSTLDRFTFINENKPVRGEFRIAVANEKLSADSDKWTSVEGAVSFKRKRLFNVSMLGVEAKYVRLTFHVEHEENVGSLTASEAVALNQSRLRKLSCSTESSERQAIQLCSEI